MMDLAKEMGHRRRAQIVEFLAPCPRLQSPEVAGFLSLVDVQQESGTGICRLAESRPAAFFALMDPPRQAQDMIGYTTGLGSSWDRFYP